MHLIPEAQEHQIEHHRKYLLNITHVKAFIALFLQLTFIHAMKNSIENALIISRRDANSHAIDNFIQFVVHLCSHFISDSDHEEPYGLIPFANIINYLVEVSYQTPPLLS